MSKQHDTIFEVEGMSCPSCIRHIGEALKKVEGVGTVDVSLESGLVVVSHEPTRAPVASLIAALAAAGYNSTARSEDRG